jgi:5-methyltetrahydropteroyltriglutamate--homocysteine methyltransferase
VGSLPRPSELLQASGSGATGAEFEALLRRSVDAVVRMQTEVGLDLINDGDYGKPMSDEVDYGAWTRYSYERTAGFEMQDVGTSLVGKDRHDFADFYASGEAAMLAPGRTRRVGVAMAPIRYVGQEQVQRDVENLTAALGGLAVSDAFICAVSAGYAEAPRPLGAYYASVEEEAVAIAEALNEEYKAITDAGISVQLDDPFLVNLYEFKYSTDGDIKSFRKWAEQHIELINHSLQGIPEGSVRYHVCWGSWKGPHSSDLPIKHVADLIVKVNAALYSVEAGNVQHEHEWKVWKDVGFPDGKLLMPGVVTHKTNVLEHPELVADRLIRYAEAIGRQHVVAGTDCGMGGRLHPQLAWAKLKALADGAALASKELWR